MLTTNIPGIQPDITLPLKDRVAFITGGTGVIGSEIVREFIRQGATVIFTYNKAIDKAKGLLDEIIEHSPYSMYIQMDVRDRLSVREAILQIKRRLNGLHILVNNAGINFPNDFDRITDEQWDEVLSVNLKGPFICTQEALSIMDDNSAIINIGSVSGQYGGPRTAHYAVSKAGLISLSQVTARFLADKKIRVNTVSVGMVESEMAQRASNSPAVRRSIESILLKRMARPQEVAKVVAFLASDHASYITAQTINVNGGLYF